MYRKKQRGQNRKLNKLVNYLEESTLEFPTPVGKFEHWHMPCSEDFLNSTKTYGKIKTKAAQCMIDCAKRLFEMKPIDIGFCHIVCLIVPKNLWNSQIIIFYDKEYYKNFFIRNNGTQKWTLLSNNQVKNEMSLFTIPSFSKRRYLEEITDEETGMITYMELWFYGELT